MTEGTKVEWNIVRHFACSISSVVGSVYLAPPPIWKDHIVSYANRVSYFVARIRWLGCVELYLNIEWKKKLTSPLKIQFNVMAIAQIDIYARETYFLLSKIDLFTFQGLKQSQKYFFFVSFESNNFECWICCGWGQGLRGFS